MGKSWRNLKIHKKRLNLCQCGCGGEANEGRRWILGHSNKGRKFSEEHKKKISEAMKGHQNFLSHKHTQKTKEKLSKINKGSKNSTFKDGKGSIYKEQCKHKKQECFFGCESNNYDLHHEPPVENILTWEGRLVNLCHSCHRKIHYGSLKLPDNVGIKWTKKDTERALEES